MGSASVQTLSATLEPSNQYTDLLLLQGISRVIGGQSLSRSTRNAKASKLIRQARIVSTEETLPNVLAAIPDDVTEQEHRWSRTIKLGYRDQPPGIANPQTRIHVAATQSGQLPHQHNVKSPLARLCSSQEALLDWPLRGFAVVSSIDVQVHDLYTALADDPLHFLLLGSHPGLRVVLTVRGPDLPDCSYASLRSAELRNHFHTCP